MIRLNCDYLEGAHPNILKRLCDTNLDQTKPYGFDEITLSAKEKIKKACGLEDQGDVYFMVGGTQTNATMLDFILRNFEGVIAADTGHISVHEAGAVEYSGHIGNGQTIVGYGYAFVEGYLQTVCQLFWCNNTTAALYHHSVVGYRFVKVGKSRNMVESYFFAGIFAY